MAKPVRKSTNMAEGLPDKWSMPMRMGTNVFLSKSG